MTPFSFMLTHTRTITREGEPWFALVDVCRVLDIESSSDAASELDDDQKYEAADEIFISESGLYSLILTGHTEAARQFTKQLTSKVLPQIRRTGTYGDIMRQLEDPATLRKLLLAYSDGSLTRGS
jgi:prophage antirepressor-like protein